MIDGKRREMREAGAETGDLGLRGSLPAIFASEVRVACAKVEAQIRNNIFVSGI